MIELIHYLENWLFIHDLIHNLVIMATSIAGSTCKWCTANRGLFFCQVQQGKCRFSLYLPACSAFFLLDPSKYLLFTSFNVCLHAVMQSVDITRYTDEEYEKYLADPVGIMSRLHLYDCTELHI